MPDTILGAVQRSSKKNYLTVMEESIRWSPWGGDNLNRNLNHEKDPFTQWPGESAMVYMAGAKVPEQGWIRV